MIYIQIPIIDPNIKANMTASEMAKVLSDRLIECIKNQLKL